MEAGEREKGVGREEGKTRREVDIPLPPGSWENHSREVRGRVGIWTRGREVLQISFVGERPAIAYSGCDGAVVRWINERMRDLRELGLEPVLCLQG